MPYATASDPLAAARRREIAMTAQGALICQDCVVPAHDRIIAYVDNRQPCDQCEAPRSH